MEMDEMEIILKVIVVGNGRVGKTSMITRFAKNSYSDEYKKTLGVDFLEKEMFVKSEGETVNFHIWDTAGQEEYDSLTKKYYRGARVCILAFSTFSGVRGKIYQYSCRPGLGRLARTFYCRSPNFVGYFGNHGD